MSIVNTARGSLGSTSWAESDQVILSDGFIAPAGVPKCNFFDYQMVVDGGSTMPVDALGAPPRAHDIWDSSFSMAGWTFHDGFWGIAPGSLATRYYGVFFGIPVHVNHLGLHAHTGILDYDGAWINAGPGNVNRYPHPTLPSYGFTGNAHYRSN